MSHSKVTSNLKLPQFQPGEHPDFLTDFNEAFRRIDDWSVKVDNQLKGLTQKCSSLESEIRQLRIDVGLTNVTKGGKQNESEL